MAQHGEAGDDGKGDDGCALRCLCGRLVARYVDGQVELRCHRCKRTVRIDVAGLPRPGR